MKTDLTADHTRLEEARAARRYFAKFERITGHLAAVTAEMEATKRLTGPDRATLDAYVGRIAATFRALSYKYLMTERIAEVATRALTIDRVESGFPVFEELLHMAADAQQAAGHLAGMAEKGRLIDDMLQQILGDHAIPSRLQYAMSQRLYFKALAAGGLFWTRNDPSAVWLGDEADGRRRYFIHWAVFDAQMNVPAIYLMDVVDSGRIALLRDNRRWPEVLAHLPAQSLGGLKLVTIARGFDQSFDDLHPKRLRRIHLGPMYSSAFTRQAGPIRGVLEEARAEAGSDWALAWTVETLISERVETERAGWFSTVEREVFTLDPFSGRGADIGATRMDRALILPERPFQVLSEKNPPGLAQIAKFVVGAGGRVVSAR